MTDMIAVGPDEFDDLSAQMRMANTQRLKAVLDSLEPYVDGSFGSINPGHVTAYVRTVVELGKLWNTYAPPRRVEEAQGVEEEAMVLSARQEAVLAELGKLREVGMKNQGRRAS